MKKYATHAKQSLAVYRIPTILLNTPKTLKQALNTPKALPWLHHRHSYVDAERIMANVICTGQAIQDI